jgi:hypothetical protein
MFSSARCGLLTIGLLALLGIAERGLGADPGDAVTSDVAMLVANSTSLPAENYDLFHPTPRSALSPMVTDRPGQTNGPFTVAPGHLQIETGVISYTYDHGSKLNRADFFSQSEFRVGLVPDGEIDLVLNPFTWQRQAGISTSGFGDTALQGKWNVWTDASGNSGLGLIPFVTFSTAQRGLGNGGVQGGVFFPCVTSLPADFILGFMPGAFAARNPTGGYHMQIAASVSISHSVVGTLSAFGEFASSLDPHHASDWVGTVDFGLIYLITPDLQLDAGMNVGVTHAAPDVNPFLGLSVRF